MRYQSAILVRLTVSHRAGRRSVSGGVLGKNHRALPLLESRALGPGVIAADARARSREAVDAAPVQALSMTTSSPFPSEDLPRTTPRPAPVRHRPYSWSP